MKLEGHGLQSASAKLSLSSILLLSIILSYFCYLFSNTLVTYSLHHSLILCFESVHTQQVLSLRMVIGVCTWLSQEDNASLVDLEQHQKQALGVRTNGLRFMDPRQKDLEEKRLKESDESAHQQGVCPRICKLHDEASRRHISQAWRQVSFRFESSKVVSHTVLMVLHTINNQFRSNGGSKTCSSRKE